MTPARDQPRLVELAPERIEGRTWTIYICAEPDGQDCDSGTHPNVLSHKCAALREWHEWCRDHPNARPEDHDDAPKGPTGVMVEVAPVSAEGLDA